MQDFTMAELGVFVGVVLFVVVRKFFPPVGKLNNSGTCQVSAGDNDGGGDVLKIKREEVRSSVLLI